MIPNQPSLAQSCPVRECNHLGRAKKFTCAHISQVTRLEFSLLEVGDQEVLSEARFESMDPAAGNLML